MLQHAVTDSVSCGATDAGVQLCMQQPALIAEASCRTSSTLVSTATKLASEMQTWQSS
jgi:hypothetical protein